jgi:uncharacterized protein
MSFETLSRLTADALRGGGPAHFIWHGGEPLLLGRDFYKKAVWLQQKFRRDGQLITNTLQTNGTLLDDEWLDLFNGFEFSLGLSLDGPAELHDKNRVLRGQQGTFDKVMQAVSLMRSRQQGFGVLAVVTDDAIRLGARAFFEFFVQNDLKTFAILCQRPAIIAGHEAYVDRDVHSEFVKEIFDIWFELDDPEVRIRDFESITRALLGCDHTTCLLAGGCIGRYVAIDPRGNIYHCDEFMTDEAYRIGHVTDGGLSAALTSREVVALREENERELAQIDCKWLPICNGGCPKDRYVSRRFGNGGRVECCGYRYLIEHISERLTDSPTLNRLTAPSVAAFAH